jgi:signal transduction histidine kinase
MTGKARRVLGQLVQSGVTPEISHGLAKRIVLTNKVALSLVTLSILWVPVYWSVGRLDLVFGLVFGSLLNLLIVGLNRARRRLLARVSLLMVTTFSVVWFAEASGDGVNGQIDLVPMALWTFVLFEPEEWLPRWISVCVIACTYLAFEFDLLVLPGVVHLQLTPAMVVEMRAGVAFTTLVLCIMVVKYLCAENARAETQLACSLEDLRNETAERQRQQTLTEQARIGAARIAGMAEVATGVLHNVGNVLNSVNISVSVLSERLHGLRIEKIDKVVELLRRGGQPTAQDKLAEYLEALAASMRDNMSVSRAELQTLELNVEHIKAVVSRQQSLATASRSGQESVAPSELFKDALSLNSMLMGQRGIEIVHEFAASPLLSTQRHRVLEILGNLLSNARHALMDAERVQDKRIIARVSFADGRVVLQVQDNGVGIAPEDLTRIFAFGFTTKKDGHGFGLHASALAAKELGGSLKAHSDGPGLGATFTLELPVRLRAANDAADLSRAPTAAE